MQVGGCVSHLCAMSSFWMQQHGRIGYLWRVSFPAEETAVAVTRCISRLEVRVNWNSTTTCLFCTAFGFFRTISRALFRLCLLAVLKVWGELNS